MWVAELGMQAGQLTRGSPQRSSAHHRTVWVVTCSERPSRSLLRVQRAQGVSSATDAVQLLDVRLDRRPTLLDYLAGGGTIKLLAAVDFSSSNPPDGGPGSMHHAEPDRPSACERVVTAFASSLQARPLAGFKDPGQVAGLFRGCWIRLDPSSPRGFAELQWGPRDPFEGLPHRAWGLLRKCWMLWLAVLQIACCARKEPRPPDARSRCCAAVQPRQPSSQAGLCLCAAWVLLLMTCSCLVGIGLGCRQTVRYAGC